MDEEADPSLGVVHGDQTLQELVQEGSRMFDEDRQEDQREVYILEREREREKFEV